MPRHRNPNPRPDDPPLLFATLLGARRAGDRILEEIARDWLAQAGIRVVIDDPKDRPEGEPGKSSEVRT